MNKFLDDSLALWDKKIGDAKDLALLYIKYEFNVGCKLCDRVMLEFFRNLNNLRKLDFDMVIELTSIAHEANLISAFKEGINLLIDKLRVAHKTNGRITFREAHLKKIFSLLKHVDSCNDGLVLLKSQLKIARKGEKTKNVRRTCLTSMELEVVYFALCHPKEYEVT
jgi:hypothetical protein